MARNRSANRGLTNSRIYPKHNRYYLFTAEPTISPDDGKARKWHSLCAIADGEDAARAAAKRIIDHNRMSGDEGDFGRHFRDYVSGLIAKMDKNAPREAPRLKIHQTNIKNLRHICGVIERAFVEYNVVDVQPVDIATFVDNWQGQRIAQTYHSRLSDFFRWAARRGLRNDNPVREVSVEKPKKRSRYITDDEYLAIRAALLTGNDGRPNRSGPMAQCYIDLCYLIYQRTTEIRLLKWDQIKPEGIYFLPTKTEDSTGADVIIPMTEQIKATLERAKAAYPIASIYVIHTFDGQPYTPTGIGSAWKRACKRAGVENATLKDLRAKAITDAKKAGYNIKQISTGAAHSDTAMTEQYIKRRETPISEVLMTLPVKKSA